jgi:hypothetical protein
MTDEEFDERLRLAADEFAPEDSESEEYTRVGFYYGGLWSRRESLREGWMLAVEALEAVCRDEKFYSHIATASDFAKYLKERAPGS